MRACDDSFALTNSIVSLRLELEAVLLPCCLFQSAKYLFVSATRSCMQPGSAFLRSLLRWCDASSLEDALVLAGACRFVAAALRTTEGVGV